MPVIGLIRSLDVYLDAHCHLDLPPFDADRAAVIAQGRTLGIGGYLLGGVDPAGWARQRALARVYPEVHWTAGLHPVSVAQLTPEEREDAMGQLIGCFDGEGAAIGVGETGLDRRFASPETLPAQTESFRDHLALARELERPVVLHVVGAHGHTLDVLRRDGLPAAGGLMHSYSGSAELVATYVGLGLAISFSANVLRPGAKKLRRAVAAVPRGSLLVETDAPDQAPEGRGVRNTPATLLAVADCLAAVRNEPAEDILKRSRQNLERIFGSCWPEGG